MSTAEIVNLHDAVDFYDPEPERPEYHSIWSDKGVFSKYVVTLQFTGWVMGGIPQNPEVIEGWIRTKMIGKDADAAQIRAYVIKTMDELGMEVSPDMTMDELNAVAKRVAAEQHGNTFKRDALGFYLGDYQIKAALKEVTNILFAGERWGVTRKGPKSFLAERVYVDEQRIHLGRTEPDGVHLQIGHVTGPQGPRSTLTYVHYVDQPTVSFTVSSLHDLVTEDQWRQMFVLMQKSGIGALRSMGYGQFVVTGFEKVLDFKSTKAK